MVSISVNDYENERKAFLALMGDLQSKKLEAISNNNLSKLEEIERDILILKGLRHELTNKAIVS
jgi:hypothetical protein